MISGALGGLGGFAYIVPSVTTWNFEVGVAGAGKQPGFRSLGGGYGSSLPVQLRCTDNAPLPMYNYIPELRWRV